MGERVRPDLGVLGRHGVLGRGRRMSAERLWAYAMAAGAGWIAMAVTYLVIGMMQR